VLELGTFTGYSSISMARGLRDGGRIISCDVNEETNAIARRYAEEAGVADRIEYRLGPALESIAELDGPFDLVFIDADKENNANYVEWALRLTRPGAMILVDNVVRHGSIVDPARTDPTTQGSRAVLELLGSHPGLDATALQTVGSKGWDGLAVALVRDDATQGAPE
jgi:predicted O-methyltransferase YrrM